MEVRLFDPDAPPEWTTSAWYQTRPSAPHLEETGHRDRLLLAAEYVALAIQDGARSVSDLGAGDGGLLSLLPMTVPVWGYDLQTTNVEASQQRNVDVWLLDVIQDFDAAQIGDCVIATEVLEHLVDPGLFLRRIRNAGAKWLIASSPYTETEQSHYEFHAWVWDLDGYRALLEGCGWQVVQVGTAWISQVCLCRAAP